MKLTLEQIQAMISEWFLQKSKLPNAKTVFGIPIEHIEYALTLAEQVAKGEVVVVPKEPTETMIKAAIYAYDSVGCDDWDNSKAVAAEYKAMINAAQPPQEERDERD